MFSRSLEKQAGKKSYCLMDSVDPKRQYSLIKTESVNKSPFTCVSVLQNTVMMSIHRNLAFREDDENEYNSLTIRANGMRK